MNNDSIRAQPPLDFIPPVYNAFVLKGCQFILPLWLRSQTPLAKIEAENLSILAEYYQKFQQKKVRFLLAFRHPSVNDPYCMGYLLWKLLPKFIKQENIQLQQPIHAHFMYDRGIPLWAGKAVSWLYSHLGGTSIQRGKLDLPGLRSARELFTNASFPIAAAPEGATNGHNEIISPLEPGIAQLGFWCAEDLQKSDRTEEVFIIPVGIQYFYITPPWAKIADLLTQLEKDCGIETQFSIENNQLEEQKLYERLFNLGEEILGIMENFYRESYHKNLPDLDTLKATFDDNSDTLQQLPNALFSLRLQNLLNVALEVAEQYFHIPNKGTVVDRCRRVEQAGWDCIYREEFKPDKNLSPLKRALADRVAEEADLRMWHMRMVESFVAVTGYYVREKPTVERFADTILLMWDLVARIKGGTSFSRPRLGQQRAQMTIGEPISVTARSPEYKANRRQAVANLTQELQHSLEKMIIH
ncbi:MAG: 1-acyl-sn-glycerol-3-phosphate acyltransferase [Snowella sp.]|nr:1-acyl-sn-glycerol-3-phosphate acyltransferase [Snowella sp.]